MHACNYSICIQRLGQHQTATAAETATQEGIASIRRTISNSRLAINSKQQAGVLETAEMSATV
jgi:hypothetical protein